MLALTILGNNSALPAFGRNPTAQLLQIQDQSFLIDCGEATQIQLSKYKVRQSKISHIFISHLHGDHYFGLIGLLTSMSLLNRTQDLHLHAPAPLEAIIRLQLEAGFTVLSYPLHFHPIEAEKIIVSTHKTEVSAFKVQHRIDCWGFLFREKKNPRSVDAEKAKAHEIPVSFYEELQQGKDYTNKKGVTILNKDVTSAAAPASSYAYAADTIYDERIAEKVKGVDLLYHEATYLKDQQEKAAARFHSTTVQAAQIAKLAGVKQLVIGHFSSKYENLDPFLDEAKSVFENTSLAIEGTCFKIG